MATFLIGYGKNRQKLKGGFESARDAHDYVRTHRDELVNQVKALREVSREEQRNATNRDRTDQNAARGIFRRSSSVMRLVFVVCSLVIMWKVRVVRLI